MDIDDLLARAPRAAEAPADPRLTHLVMNRVRWQARPAAPAAGGRRAWWPVLALVAVACACLPWPGDALPLDWDAVLLIEALAAALLAALALALAARRTA